MRSRVSCQAADDGQVGMTVADTGPGLSADELSWIFTPFERLGAAQTTIEGTGIGLPLARALAQAMGGTLTATSAPGQGVHRDAGPLPGAARRIGGMRLDAGAARRLFAGSAVARLATVTPAGHPHIVPVTFVLDSPARATGCTPRWTTSRRAPPAAAAAQHPGAPPGRAACRPLRG